MSEPTKIQLEYARPAVRPTFLTTWWPLGLAGVWAPSLLLLYAFVSIATHFDAIGEFFAIAIVLTWPAGALVGMVLGSHRLRRRPRAMAAGIVIISANAASLFLFSMFVLAFVPL